LPRNVLDGEIDIIKRLGLDFRMNMRLGRDVTLTELLQQFDAAILTVGNMQKTDPSGLGVEATARTIRIDASTYQTNIPGVFAGGSAIRTGYDPARSVGDGRILAECVDGFLKGRTHHAGHKDFTSTIPKMPLEEYRELAKGAVATLSVRELITEAETAAGRCCHCDCRSASNCRLRIFAETYEVDPKAYLGEHRRKFEFIRQPAGVIFEPGKCISCGICVELAAQARAPLGMTFIGRGFDLKIGVPLDGQLAEGLQKVAEECVMHCPTGALTFEDESKNVIKGQSAAF
jgi:ferredoxin